ncbi:MAG: hypothetical protein JWR32_1151 [Mycobacterium sp.]|jgi:hypothetical protein|nr:hypothetical protein [Mycobacterium sp.]
MRNRRESERSGLKDRPNFWCAGAGICSGAHLEPRPHRHFLTTHYTAIVRAAGSIRSLAGPLAPAVKTPASLR